MDDDSMISMWPWCYTVNIAGASYLVNIKMYSWFDIENTVIDHTWAKVLFESGNWFLKSMTQILQYRSL